MHHCSKSLRSDARVPVALARSGARYDSSSGFCPAVAESQRRKPAFALSFAASFERAAVGFLQRWLSSQIDDVELGRGAGAREALLRADLLARLGADLEELAEAIVVEDDDVLAAVAHRLDRAPPVRDHRERTHDEHASSRAFMRSTASHAVMVLPSPTSSARRKPARPGGARGDDGAHRLLLVRAEHDRRRRASTARGGAGRARVELALDVELPRVRQRAERRERGGQRVAARRRRRRARRPSARRSRSRRRASRTARRARAPALRPQ